MYGLLPLRYYELLTLGYTDLSHIGKTDEFRLYRAFTHEGQGMPINTPASVPHLVQHQDQGLMQAYDYYACWGTWVTK